MNQKESEKEDHPFFKDAADLTGGGKFFYLVLLSFQRSLIFLIF